MSSAAAVLICVILGALAVFQILLVARVPIGHFAWGGQHRILPTRLRIGSIISIVLYAAIGLVVLDRANLLSILPGEAFAYVAMWVLTGYFALGIVLNGISRSKQERYTMTPVVIALTALCLVTAAS